MKKEYVDQTHGVAEVLTLAFVERMDTCSNAVPSTTCRRGFDLGLR